MDDSTKAVLVLANGLVFEGKGVHAHIKVENIVETSRFIQNNRAVLEENREIRVK